MKGHTLVLCFLFFLLGCRPDGAQGSGLWTILHNKGQEPSTGDRPAPQHAPLSAEVPAPPPEASEDQSSHTDPPAESHLHSQQKGDDSDFTLDLTNRDQGTVMRRRDHKHHIKHNLINTHKYKHDDTQHHEEEAGPTRHKHDGVSRKVKTILFRNHSLGHGLKYPQASTYPPYRPHSEYPMLRLPQAHRRPQHSYPPSSIHESFVRPRHIHGFDNRHHNHDHHNHDHHARPPIQQDPETELTKLRAEDTLLTTATNESCPMLYERVGDHCVAVITIGQATWYEALEFCHSILGELISFHDVNLFIDFTAFLRERDVQENLWVGGYARDSGSWPWRWLDGSPMPRGTPYWAVYNDILRIRCERYCDSHRRYSGFGDSDEARQSGREFGSNMYPKDPTGGSGSCVAMDHANFYYLSNADCGTDRKAPVCVLRDDVAVRVRPLDQEEPEPEEPQEPQPEESQEQEEGSGQVSSMLHHHDHHTFFDLE